jgi:hypothetical protein
MGMFWILWKALIDNIVLSWGKYPFKILNVEFEVFVILKNLNW